MMQHADTASDDHSSCGGSTRRSSISSTVGKTGRKGDPRMHRAVEARIANPKLSLLNALKIGGFEYQNDDDANIVDSENVTLGQRKNQLSRRIRLAIKQARETCPESETSFDTTAAPNATSYQGSSKRRLGSPKSDAEVTRLAIVEGMDALYGRNDEHHVQTCLTPEGKVEQADQTMNAANSTCTHSLHQPLFIPEETTNHQATMAISTAYAMADLKTQQASMMTLRGSSQPPHTKRRRTATPSQRRHTPTSTSSTVAVASLSQTAASIGMTLDQLALALRSSNNLAKTLIPSPTPSKAQQALAVALYQNENRGLYARSMLLAGFSPEVAQNEQSPHHLQVALDAWQLEGRRLQSLVRHSKQHRHDEDQRPRENSIDISSVSTAGNGNGALFNESKGNDNGNISHLTKLDHHNHATIEHSATTAHQNHNHSMHRADGHHNASSSSSDLECINETSRHIHRLGGKCGHVPILHQPVGGLPHIDFVVGDRVECYQGVQALSQDLLWPSSFCCEDLSCPDTCRENTVPAKPKDHEHKHAECIIGGDPKVFDLNELNLDGVEWNLDFATGDSVLGLFKLADQ